MPAVFTDLHPDCSEEAFGQALMQVAQILGYLCYHQRPCRTEHGYRTALEGNKGYPDWTLVHARTGATIIAELKAKGGRVSPEQQAWLDALAKGPTPAFLWRPSDWAEVLSVLEAGARQQPHDLVSQGSKDLTPVKASDDPDYRHAEQTVTTWWEYHKTRNDGKPPTALPFVACVKVVQKLYKAGWDERDVKFALVDTLVVSVGAMEYARKKREQGVAPRKAEAAEWHERNAGKPLTEREPRPSQFSSEEGHVIIETTSTEVEA